MRCTVSDRLALRSPSHTRILTTQWSGAFAIPPLTLPALLTLLPLALPCCTQGALLGGAIGDRLARRSPNHGRILTAQMSVASGIPLTLLLFKGLPGSGLSAFAPAYGLVMFVAGLTCSWAGTGCNSPIFSELVPDDMRSTIYAFDRWGTGQVWWDGRAWHADGGGRFLSWQSWHLVTC